MSKLFFIIGMRRSGTSILRDLILKHPEVQEIKFEPYELWYSIRVSHLSRYRNDTYIKKIIKDFSRPSLKYRGAKFALNAGIEAMTWRRLGLVFPEAKFIFIVRDSEQTYKSWVGQDKNSVRGLCSKELYMKFRNHIVDSFDKNCIINYKNLVENTDEEMKKIWPILELNTMTGFNKYIHKPKNWSNNEK